MKVDTIIKAIDLLQQVAESRENDMNIADKKLNLTLENVEHYRRTGTLLGAIGPDPAGELQYKVDEAKKEFQMRKGMYEYVKDVIKELKEWEV